MESAPGAVHPGAGRSVRVADRAPVVEVPAVEAVVAAAVAPEAEAGALAAVLSLRPEKSC